MKTVTIAMKSANKNIDFDKCHKTSENWKYLENCSIFDSCRQNSQN